MANDVGIKELLESGVHFGHQTRRWNPKMRRFIHGERSGIYIIDLLQTQRLLTQAQDFATELARRGGTILFVGTKKQARDAVKEVAESAGQPYVNNRWLGGLLTNFQTISQRIRRLHDLERYESDGQLELLPTRERMAAQADLAKLRLNLGGVKNMQRTPDAAFIIDLKTEAIAVREAQRLRIPIIGLVDTNCDPDGIDFVVPGNDDAIRACYVITRAIGDVVAEGAYSFRAEEDRARLEAEEQTRRQAEERARAEAEERARVEAAEHARREAEAQLSTAEGGGDRQVAEAEVAEAVQAEGRPVVEGTGSAEAGAAAQAADEPAMAAVGTGTGPSQQEERREGDTGEQVPQEAGAAQAEGSPASDTAAPPRRKPVTRPPAEAGKKPAARKPRAKKADKKEEPKTETETETS
jgi:small subunit ribosomal protein S2